MLSDTSSITCRQALPAVFAPSPPALCSAWPAAPAMTQSTDTTFISDSSSSLTLPLPPNRGRDHQCGLPLKGPIIPPRLVCLDDG